MITARLKVDETYQYLTLASFEEVSILENGVGRNTGLWLP